MSDGKIISFSDYLKKQNKELVVDSNLIEALGQDIKNRPELLEWYQFQNAFHGHKLFLHSLFSRNRREDNVNPNAGYFLSFSEEQIERNVNEIETSLEWLNRKYVLIEATECTFKDLAKQLYGVKPRSTHDAWVMFEEILLHSSEAIVISRLSQSKIPSRKPYYATSIIKINDDAHLRGINPASDILFVDYADFLQRSWSDLGSYIEIFASSGHQGF